MNYGDSSICFGSICPGLLRSMIAVAVCGLFAAPLAAAPAESSPREVSLLMQQADAARRQGKFELAGELYARARHAVEATDGPDSVRLILPLVRQGTLLYIQGESAAADELFARANDIARSHPDADVAVTGPVLDAVALAASDKGDHASAASAFERALALRRAAENVDAATLATNLHRLGSTYRMLGRLADARSAFEEALAISAAIAEKTGGRDEPLYAAILNEYALVYYDIGEYERAERMLDESLAIRERVFGEDHPTLAFVLLRLGSIYDAQGRYGDAERAHRRALEIRRKQLGDANPLLAMPYANLGRSLLLQGRHQEAIGPLLRSREIVLAFQLQPYRDFELGRTTRMLGEAYRGVGDPARARDFFEESVAILTVVQRPDQLWQTLHAYSTFLAEQDEGDAAILHSKRAVNIVQQMRADAAMLEPELQRTLVLRREAVYRHLANLLIEAGRLREAQRVIELLKGEEFLAFMRGAAPAGSRPIESLDYTEREKAWSDRLEGVASTGEAYQKVLRDLSEDLDAGGKVARGTRGLTAEMSGASMADLRAGVVAVHMLVAADRIRLLVSTRDGLVLRDSMVPAESLAHAVFELREAVAHPRADARAAARQLSDLTLAPIEDLIRGARLLVLSLDGVLRYAPIAALHDGQRYLVERHALVLRTPAANPVRLQPNLDAWFVAGFGMTRGDGILAPLPAVAAELERIVRRDTRLDNDGVLPGRIYLDEQFTAAQLRSAVADSTPVVHVASHFVLQAERASASYLLLGDGSHLGLTEFESSGLNFNGVQLLALSACDTAAPAGGDGREVEGFGTLAQLHGAARVLATLWPVADSSTSEFMWRVYAFREKGHALPEALRRAQLSFLKGRAGALRPRLAPYAHPFYWAPYVLMGDWR
jgi:CHAT domain-containing protein